MERLGFKGPHSQETKDKISRSLQGKRPGGFNVRVQCQYCKIGIAKPNLQRHETSCKRLHDCFHIFPEGTCLAKLKHFNICLRSNYNIDVYDYMKMYESQKGKCKICLKLERNGRNLSVDHCHNTNRIRGLLCSDCNLTLDKWNDDIEIFKRAIEYLKD